MSARTADVVVIGGGIHGCSTALHLALRGLKPILVEKDYAGRHASGVNAGGVRQLARHIAEIPLSVASMALWEEIEELVGDDCGFESHGTVLVAESDDELAGFRARVDDLRLRGFTHEELIDRAELKRLVPAVADHCPGGVVSRRDGVKQKAWFCGPPGEIIDGIRSIEAKYPGLEDYMVHWAEGLPPAEFKDQLRRFAKEVMPAFEGAKMAAD